MLESDFSKDLKIELRHMFPGCHIFKQDANRLQGIPDLLILWEDHWAMLETKKRTKATRQPNQDYYVDHFNRMSFAAFIQPENKREVLDALQRSFGTTR